MNLDQFWNIVDRVHQASGSEMEKKQQLLDSELRRLPLNEVLSWADHFSDSLRRAYTWPLWAAAYIMGGGCSDDGFQDFRSTLISMGRLIYERALEDPESMTELDLEDGMDMQWEGYQYVAGKVLRDLNGGREIPRSLPHPHEPAGVRWDELTVAQLFPKLAECYNFSA